MKICIICKEVKNEADFYKRSESSHGFRLDCKSCHEKARALRPKLNIIVTAISRECTMCLQTKAAKHFDKNKRTASGLVSVCKDCRKAKSRAYYESKKEEIKAKNNKHYHESDYKTRSRESRREYQKRKMKEDPLYVMARRLRNRLYYALKHKFWKKDTKFFQYIGCTLEELKAHIEGLFEPGMTWENRTEWHLDHHIPLVSAKTEEELYKLCHYTNLKPMWGADNIKKGSKID